VLNEHDKLCITGYHDLGSLGGAANKAALIKSGGYVLNDKGERGIKGYQDLCTLGRTATHTATHAATHTATTHTATYTATVPLALIPGFLKYIFTSESPKWPGAL